VLCEAIDPRRCVEKIASKSHERLSRYWENDSGMWPERSQCRATRNEAIRAEQSVFDRTRQDLSIGTKMSAVDALGVAVEVVM
jgi:hypothetical protein